MGRLDGKVAIVTGAGQGIGRAIAHALAREGARGLRRGAEVPPRRADRGGDPGTADGEAMSSVVDVGKRGDVDAMVEETVRRYGTVDILVNNAHGFGPRGPLEEIPEEQFDMSWRTGVKGTWWAMCAVLPMMRGARLGTHHQPRLARRRGGACAARRLCRAKGGIVALSRVAAREWGTHGITST